LDALLPLTLKGCGTPMWSSVLFPNWVSPVSFLRGGRPDLSRTHFPSAKPYLTVDLRQGSVLDRDLPSFVASTMVCFILDV
jgi:hypothetical protein